jgi:hypothetical protein
VSLARRGWETNFQPTPHRLPATAAFIGLDFTLNNVRTGSHTPLCALMSVGLAWCRRVRCRISGRSSTCSVTRTRHRIPLSASMVLPVQRARQKSLLRQNSPLPPLLRTLPPRQITRLYLQARQQMKVATPDLPLRAQRLPKSRVPRQIKPRTRPNHHPNRMAASPKLRKARSRSNGTHRGQYRVRP